MDGMSEREYSSHSGLSRGAIQNAKRGGRLVFYADGSINAAASDARREEMADPDQQRRSLGGDAAIHVSGSGGSASYLKARTALTVYQAQERQLAIQKKKGMLVDRARAEALVFRLARHQARPRQSTPVPCSASWNAMSVNSLKRWLISGFRWVEGSGMVASPRPLWASGTIDPT